MKILVNFAVTLFIAILTDAKHETYRGSVVYKISPKSEDHFAFLKNIYDTENIDFWSMPTYARHGIVMVRPEQKWFVDELSERGIEFETEVEDLVAFLRQEDERVSKSRSLRNTRNLSYDSYYRHAEINSYLDTIAAAYPNTVTLVDAGRSYENREIKYLKISTTNFTDISKPIIVLDAAMHAREWITVPVATYAIRKLVEDITESDIVNNVDWIIHPLANPDGYEYSFDTERLWRKTRSLEHPNAALCPGVDGNRNYDYHWEDASESSRDECSIIYRGPTVFSEPETRIVRDMVLEHLERVQLYISIHSYGNMFLYAWAFDGAIPPNGLDLHFMGVSMANAINANMQPNVTNQQDYIVGNSASILYFGTGISKDYMQLLGVPLSYTLELPGYGYQFSVPPEYIEQVTIETWAGFVQAARYVIRQAGL